MLIGAVELILILITLLAAIAGTISSPSGRIKAIIIGLAVIASIGTIVKTLDAARKSKINENLIASLVHASNPPEYFSHDLVKFIAPLLEKSGHFVSGQTVFKDSGERILILGKSEDNPDNPSGVLFLSRRQMNPIFYEYAIEGDMTKPLSNHLNQQWTDCSDHWNACFAELWGIGKLAMEIAPINVEETTAEMTQDPLSFSLVSSETYRDRPIRIELEKEFIESLYRLSPAERGLKILTAGQLEIADQL